METGLPALLVRCRASVALIGWFRVFEWFRVLHSS
jgi:hypothetical protein